MTLGIICLLIFLIGAVILFQKTTEPINPIGDRQAVSTMWHTNTSLLVDQDKISKIDSANINNSKQEEKSETPAEEEQIDENDSVEDSQESGDGNGDSSTETPDISQIVDIDKNSQSSGEQQGNNPGQSNNGNDTSDEGERDEMATEQGYYALVSYNRLLEDETPIWIMTDVDESDFNYFDLVIIAMAIVVGGIIVGRKNK